MNVMSRTILRLGVALSAGMFGIQNCAADAPEPGNSVHTSRAASDDQAALKKEARITMARARKIALAKVPSGQIQTEELERENGKLIYSFDIKSAKGITEVSVDAKSGKILDVQTETAAQEAAEQKNDTGKLKH